MVTDIGFKLGVRFPRVAHAIHDARRWWRPYGPEGPVEKIKALDDACKYFHDTSVIATYDRDQARAETERLRTALTDIGEYVEKCLDGGRHAALEHIGWVTVQALRDAKSRAQRP